MNASAIEVSIEELVLHGFGAGDRYAIAEAVERELARLLAEQGAPPFFMQEGAVARLNAGSFAAAPAAMPETLGARIAQAVYEGCNP